MIKIVRGSECISVDFLPDQRVIDALNRARQTIGAPCGGRGTCGKCRVQILENCPEPTETDRSHISERDLSLGFRLACQTPAVDGMAFRLPEAKASVVTEGGIDAVFSLDPPVCVLKGDVSQPSLDSPKSDVDRFLRAIDAEGVGVSLKVLRNLHEIVRGEGSVYAAVFDDLSSRRLLTASHAPIQGLALCYDIGTTTIAAYLQDLSTGQLLGTASALNPQRPYGADVITRAEYASQGDENLSRLSKLVLECAVDLADQMLAAASAKRSDVLHVAFVGNTVMMHLLLGLQPKHIAVLPFVPVNGRMLHLPAGELGLPFENAYVTAGPCISGYVGADTVAAALAADMDVSQEVNLLIDIGTNGEIVLGKQGQLYCCSAAAGPAFEGAHIRCGSGAVDGAIDTVRIGPEGVRITTIHGHVPCSICGSGIVDAVAEMYARGILDETGRLDPDEVPDEYLKYVSETDYGPAFHLTDDVFICQKDIREVQLAKAAIAAGIETLMDASSTREGDVQTLYLAGGFGNYINPSSAAEIGLIPKSLVGRVKAIGNAAGSGCRRMTLERIALQRAAQMKDDMRYIELSARPDFQERFAENMLFP